jgi:hypothetical protein
MLSGYFGVPPVRVHKDRIINSLQMEYGGRMRARELQRRDSLSRHSDSVQEDFVERRLFEAVRTSLKMIFL